MHIPPCAARPAPSGVERRVNLSSIRAPRMGTRDRAPEPWAVEAKEFLRCVAVMCVAAVDLLGLSLCLSPAVGGQVVWRCVLLLS